MEAAEFQISRIEKEFCDKFGDRDFEEDLDEEEYVFVNIRRRRRNVVLSVGNKTPPT
jgi:hypothetical protein